MKVISQGGRQMGKATWAKRMAARFDKVPCFREKFNSEFIEEAKKHPMCTVDDEALSLRILKELGAEDPAEAIE